jgi:hypothetical protein
MTLLLPSRVVNPDKPLKGDWDFKLKKVWTLNKAGDDVFAGPGMAVSDDGTLCVRDWKNKAYYLFSSTGDLKKTFAKQGEGPGEVKWYAFSSFSIKDTFILTDMDRFHYFTKEGEFVKSVRGGFFQYEPHLFIDENEYMAAPTCNLPGGKGEITHVNLKTGEKKIIKEFSVSRERLPQGRHPICLFGLTPMIRMGYDYENQKLYYGINNSYVINAADLNGNILDTFSVERERRKISTETIKKELETFYPAGSTSEALKGLPREITHFRKIQVIDGLIYVFADNFGVHWENQQIDIFSPDGKYLYRSVINPEKGSEIYFSVDNHVIKDSHLYIILEDETGEIVITKYRIELPRTQ